MASWWEQRVAPIFGGGAVGQATLDSTQATSQPTPASAATARARADGDIVHLENVSGYTVIEKNAQLYIYSGDRAVLPFPRREFDARYGAYMRIRGGESESDQFNRSSLPKEMPMAAVVALKNSLTTYQSGSSL